MISKEVQRITEVQGQLFSEQLKKVESFLGELEAAGVEIKKAEYELSDSIQTSSISPSFKTYTINLSDQ